jgi:hypothetical protein
MCDMPADRSKNTLVLRLWPASEVNSNWTSVVGSLLELTRCLERGQNQ